MTVNGIVKIKFDKKIMKIRYLNKWNLFFYIIFDFFKNNNNKKVTLSDRRIFKKYDFILYDIFSGIIISGLDKKLGYVCYNMEKIKEMFDDKII